VNISKTYTTIGDMDQLDWEAIGSYDFRIAEHGPDRIRRKHAEFLVHGHVPVACIAALLVLDTERKAEMETLIKERDLDIKVVVDQKRKWFFS